MVGLDGIAFRVATTPLIQLVIVAASEADGTPVAAAYSWNAGVMA